MNQAANSDEERRQEADQRVIGALNQLQRSAGDQQPASGPHSEQTGYDLSIAAEEQPPINPLLVLLDFFIAIALTILLQIPTILIFLGARGDLRELLASGNREALEQAIRTPGFFIIATFLQASIFLLVVVTRTIVLNKRSWRWLGLGRDALSFGAVGWGIIGGLLFLLVNVLFGVLAQTLGLQQPDQAQLFPLEQASLAGVIAVGFGVVVLAPLSEELFFRAYAQRVFVEHLGAWPGILTGAVLFTLPHLLTITQGFVVLTGAVFIGGVILGWVYWRTENLVASIVAHAINNSAAFLSILFAPQVEGFK